MMRNILLCMALAVVIAIGMPSAMAATYTCGSCDDCNTAIASAFPGDIIQLNASLYSDVSGCILDNSINDIAIDCNGYTITSSIITFGAINIQTASNVTVSNCSWIAGWDTGVYLYASDNNTIENCTFYGNANGFHTYGGNYNVMRNNNISFESAGFLIESANQIAENNTIADNNYGIAFYSGSGNIFRDNIIARNAVTGTYIISGGNYYYNNLFNNTVNVIDFTSGSEIWNIGRTVAGINIVGGPNKGGNYWGYPNGTCFSDTCVDASHTGICDAPYYLDGTNIDYLPLSLPGAGPSPPTSPGAACISNISLRSFYNEQSMVINDTGNYSVSITGYKDSACQWGCDNSTAPASCRISPLEGSLYFFAFIAAILVVAGVLYTRKR